MTNDNTNGKHVTEPVLFRYDPQDPLGQGDGESLRANQALRDYCLMGSGRSLRSLLKVYLEREAASNQAEKPPTNSFSTLGTWSTLYQWVPRARDYDRLEHASRLTMRQQRMVEWEKRSWEVAEQMLEKATQMLKFPLIQTTTADGKTTVEPARWTIDTIPRLIQVADRLARLSTGTETEIQKVRFDWRDTLPQGVSADDVEGLLDMMVAQALESLKVSTEADLDDDDTADEVNG